MNKTAIKNFAIRARRKLIEDITQKAYEVGISKERILEVETFEGGFKVKGRENSRVFKKYEIKQRDKLIQHINNKGFDQVIEEVAYTWFNRFIALRFMEVNEYLPTGVRILSSTDATKAEPDIIKEALNIDLDIDKELVFRLQDSQDTDDLYKYLLIKQCNQLGQIMPSVFEEIADYTELLLPNKLMGEGSVIRDLVDSIEEYDWKIELTDDEKKEESEKGEHGIEIIGWLYQYYISEKKDEVFAGLKKNQKITKENIPAATQLFTPKWIVKYMVENSLGRLWLESHPNEGLKEQWKYYLEEAEQDPEVQQQLDALKNPNLNPEEIKVLDPAMGSGHILVYAFDVLYDIYLSAGYSERDIPTLILEKNLYGLDIDDRAGQMASFALLMKARSKNRRVFRYKPKLNLCSIQESCNISKEALNFLFKTLGAGTKREIDKFEIEYLVNIYRGAKEYGALIELKNLNIPVLMEIINDIKNYQTNDLFELQLQEELFNYISPILKQARIMTQRYSVVCTNPPYMGGLNMNQSLKSFLSKHYKAGDTDFYAAFLLKSMNFLEPTGRVTMVTQQSFMFLGSFSNLRQDILDQCLIRQVAHLGPHAFEDIGGQKVNTMMFVFQNAAMFADKKSFIGRYVQLTDLKSSSLKERTFKALRKQIKNERVYSISQGKYEGIEGTPFVYWLSEKSLEIFHNSEKLDSRDVAPIAFSRKGLTTGDDTKFVRYFWEINFSDLNIKWHFISKGEKFSRWKEPFQKVVLWDNNGYEMKNFKTADGKLRSVLRNTSFYDREGITYGMNSSLGFSSRIKPKEVIISANGPGIFPNRLSILYLLGFLNSEVCQWFLSLLSPTITFNISDIDRLPIVNPEAKSKEMVENFVSECIKLKDKLISYEETNYEFCRPLFYNFIGDKFLNEVYNLCVEALEPIHTSLRKFEGLIDKEIRSTYNIESEALSIVKSEDEIIGQYDTSMFVKGVISYCVGLIFGRFSLEMEGITRWDNDFNIDDKIVVDSNVLPIVDGHYLENDVVDRIVILIRKLFGSDKLEDNLTYIAETLGKKANETSRQAIRRYFLKDFYNDHVKTYKKRPIYWLFDSGKENGFKALIYMHRYDPYTVARVRTDYLHKLQKQYEAEVNHIDILLESNISDREKVAARKRKETILKQIQECKAYDQVIAHVANQKVEIDLDDGVVVNYAKFQGVEIPQGEGKKPLKADLLAKI